MAHHGLGNTSFASCQTESVTPDNAHHSISHHAKDEASANSSTLATLQPTMPLTDSEPDVVNLSTCESDMK